jgi:hypothetical protein
LAPAKLVDKLLDLRAQFEHGQPTVSDTVADTDATFPFDVDFYHEHYLGHAA